jgi:hypothetical protein
MSFKSNDHIRVTKLGPVSEPYYATPSWDEYNDGSNAYTIPTDYEAEGLLMVPLELEKPLIIDRWKRNGVEVRGLFRSSPVKKIIEESEFRAVFETLNSRYQMDRVLE